MKNLATKLMFLLLLVSQVAWSQTQPDPRKLVKQAGAGDKQLLRWNSGTSAWEPSFERTQFLQIIGTIDPELQLLDNDGAVATGLVVSGYRGLLVENDGGNLSLSLPTGTTGQVLKWSGSAWVADTDLTSTKVLREESFTATASQTNFTIAYSAPAVSGTSVPLRVFRNGVRLFWVSTGPTINQFTYSGTSVTTAANAVNDIITIEYLN